MLKRSERDSIFSLNLNENDDSFTTTGITHWISMTFISKLLNSILTGRIKMLYFIKFWSKSEKNHEKQDFSINFSKKKTWNGAQTLLQKWPGCITHHYYMLVSLVVKQRHATHCLQTLLVCKSAVLFNATL